MFLVFLSVHRGGPSGQGSRRGPPVKVLGPPQVKVRGGGCIVMLTCHLKLFIITARKRSLREGNVFSISVFPPSRSRSRSGGPPQVKVLGAPQVKVRRGFPRSRSGGPPKVKVQVKVRGAPGQGPGAPKVNFQVKVRGLPLVKVRGGPPGQGPRGPPQVKVLGGPPGQGPRGAPMSRSGGPTVKIQVKVPGPPPGQGPKMWGARAVRLLRSRRRTVLLFYLSVVCLQRKKDDEKELISEFDAESCVTGGTSPNVVKLDFDFAASTKHYGGTPSPPPSPPRPDEDGLDAPGIQLMMENSGHTLVTSSSSSPSVHPSAPAQTSSTSASSS